MNRSGCGSDNEKWQPGCHLLELCVSQDGKFVGLIFFFFYLCSMNMCQLWLAMPAGVTQLGMADCAGQRISREFENEACR